MSSSTSSSAAQQTNSDENPHGQSTPPLLPAFLITGLLLGAIVFIIVWRHLIERRALEREENDPTWPSDGFGGGGTNAPTPKLWELQFSNNGARASWTDIMPLSVTPLRGQSKPRSPRYLVPSDRPVTFFDRMFGGDRREPPATPLPPISVLTQTGVPQILLQDEDEHDGAIDRLQVAVLVALPHPHTSRRSSVLPEKTEAGLQTIAECSDTEDADLPASPDKGKKRSLEIPAYVAKGSYCDDDEEGPLEVAFGTAVLPFAAFGKDP